MRSAARDLVELLADGGPEEAEASELLAWLSAGHFTFLGYRAYDLVGDGDKPELKPVPAPASASSATTARTRSPSPRRAAGTASSGRGCSCSPSRPRCPPSTGPATWTTWRSAGSARRRARSSGSTGSSGCTRRPPTPSRSPASRCCGTRSTGCSRSPGCPRTATTARPSSRSSRATRARSCSRSARSSWPRSPWPCSASAERKQVRLFLRPDAYGRYVSCLVYLPSDRYTTQVRLRAQEILRSAFGGVLGRLQRDGGQLGPRPAARRGARRRRAARSPRSTRRPSRRASPPRSAPGTMTWPRRRSAIVGAEANTPLTSVRSATWAARLPALPPVAESPHQRELPALRRRRHPHADLVGSVRAHVQAIKQALAPWHASYDYYDFKDTPATAAAVLPPASFRRLLEIETAHDPSRSSSPLIPWPG